MRVNKVVELLESRQPAYFEFVDTERAGGYDGVLTWCGKRNRTS
jgi:hypothetical protein